MGVDFDAGASSPEHSSTPSASTPDTPSDRNSIGFLLNLPGETDFMREFPKSTTLSPNNTSAEMSNAMAMGTGFLPMGGDIPMGGGLPMGEGLSMGGGLTIPASVYRRGCTRGTSKKRFARLGRPM